MSPDAYHAMAHRLGWVHEYFDGAAQLRPSPTAIATLERPIDPRTARRYEPPGDARARLPGLTVRTATASDRTALIAAFESAFDAGPDYCGYPPEDYRREALKHTDPQTARLRVACLHRRPVGAIRLSVREDRTTIEPVWVRRDVQRRGIASALLAHVIDELAASGGRSLRSRCHLANDASLHWHRRNGFVETPSWFATSARLTHSRWMARHHELAGDRRAANRARYAATRYATALESLSL